MTKDSSDKENAFSRLEYRRYVAWSTRIQREAPLILDTVNRTETRRVLDLGCGTGEHSRFLAGEGFEVVGVDLSETLLAQAQAEPGSSGVRFVQLDLRDLPSLDSGRFGGAICLGNTLVNLREESGLERFAQGLSGLLVPGGRILIQILNYHGLRERKVRHLQLNFIEDEGRERVFLRMMQYLPGGMVRFYPVTLQLDPSANEPVEIAHARAVELRGWELEEMKPVLERNGLRVVRVLGDMVDEDFDPVNSSDLVVIAEHSA